MRAFASSLEHILAELERIDLLIQAAVACARQTQGATDEFQGLYIPEQEVDALLSRPAGLPLWATTVGPRSLPEVRAALDRIADAIARRKPESVRCGVGLRLDALNHRFHLSSFDSDALLVCLAPELDLRYERLYAYLQDDVTKRRPSIDLVLNLLCPSFEAKLACRQRFAPQAPLVKQGLLSLFDDPSQQQPPLLGKYLKVDERIVSYLFESDELDARLLPYAQAIAPHARMEDLLLPDELKRRLVGLTRDQDRPLVFYFQGSYGAGKQTAAEALGRESGRRLLVVDGERLINTEEIAFETAVRLILREALLQDAVIYWDGFDSLLADERSAWQSVLLRTLEEAPGPAILAGNSTWEPADIFWERPFVRVEFPRPAYRERLSLWQASLNRDAFADGDADLPALADKFRFTGGQIRDAAATARNLARWRDPDGGSVTAADLYTACRLQSNRKLATLARKITPHYTWDDIVLPADRLRQLREICNQVKYRARVYDDWGFDRKLSLGKGLNVLFAGPSGTGKTMAAEIMAGELGLDLYRIDLSTVVSKYIGETEKNLARIFAEAETSNAILFFDEADALFGRRSEVRDSHDRYANIEISYLLQRMEEYGGMAILATNLHKNMDEAFVRRMHFTIEFPFPDQANRLRIWEKIWPAEMPQASDLDLDFMARRFEITGGAIRNIALGAAFLAAADGQVVNMNHLVRATQREYQKMGKVVVDGEFGQYAAHVAHDA
jgi:SpoVK/Ycf46/Vps4 family AAA+-type ATPase